MKRGFIFKPLSDEESELIKRTWRDKAFNEMTFKLLEQYLLSLIKPQFKTDNSYGQETTRC